MDIFLCQLSLTPGTEEKFMACGPGDLFLFPVVVELLMFALTLALVFVEDFLFRLLFGWRVDSASKCHWLISRCRKREEMPRKLCRNHVHLVRMIFRRLTESLLQPSTTRLLVS